MEKEMFVLYDEKKPLETTRRASATLAEKDKSIYTKGFIKKMINHSQIASFFQIFNKK